jgi:hypothetical protein
VREQSWATPQSRDFRSAEGNADRWENPERSRNLNDQIKAWATPNAFCFQPPENTESWQKRAAMQSEKGVNLHKPVQSQVLHENEKVAGPIPPSAMKLNPRWVETLMGLPVGWVMPSCQNPITPQGDASPSQGTSSWKTPIAMDGKSSIVSLDAAMKENERTGGECSLEWASSYAELCVSCDNRTDELRLLGNGVVPATAALAFRTLWEELTWK